MNVMASGGSACGLQRFRDWEGTDDAAQKKPKMIRSQEIGRLIVNDEIIELKS
jgi:hypothetical protein